jgi:hypothetical protein
MGSGGRTLRFAQIDDLFLIVHAHADPDPRDWALLMDESRTSARRFRRSLVSSGDAKLTPKQRSELAEFVRGHECKIAVLLDSAITRGMVTALGWVTGKYRAFDSNDIEGAAAYLGTQLEPARIRDEILSMRKEMRQAHAVAG